MSKKKNILVFGGHLDDSVLAIGGIIKKYTNAGHNVSVVCFGCGDEGFDSVEKQLTVKEKFYKEAIEAHKVLGVEDFICYNYSDFEVNESKDIYRFMMKEIRRVKPDIIFSHQSAEYFQHRAIARMAEDTWFQSGWACSADLGKPHLAEKLYQFEVLQTMVEPSHIVDITETFQDKLNSWAKFITGQEHLSAEFDKMEAKARFYGSKIGVKYAEVLKRSLFIAQKVEKVDDL